MNDIAVSNGLFWVIAVYVPNNQRQRVNFFCQLGPLLVDSSCLVLMGNWNTILDPKIDRGGELVRGHRAIVPWLI